MACASCGRLVALDGAKGSTGCHREATLGGSLTGSEDETQIRAHEHEGQTTCEFTHKVTHANRNKVVPWRRGNSFQASERGRSG
jgi:hypothetical protein